MLIILIPLAWVLLLSIKSVPDAYTGRLFPDVYDFTHYGYVMDKIDTLPTNLFNSVYVTAATVLLTTICAVLGGYALVHLKLPGAKGYRVSTDCLPLFSGARCLAHLHFRNSALSEPNQHNERAHLALCYA